MTSQDKLREAVADLVGERCERAENPHGSILSIDIGPLGLRIDDSPGTKSHGWRHLTVLSPWRLQDADQVVADWNVEGGVHGALSRILSRLIGDRVVAAETSGPAWDLVLRWESGLVLFVFSDSTDEREDAWFILGTDGLEVSAAPEMANLPVLPND